MISTGTGFKILSRDSIDERFILSKDQMLNINEAVQPEKYFCVCTDDSMLYVYNVNNPVDAETGKFRKASSNESVDPSIFQKINDDTLITEDKTIVGAINELKTNISNINTGGGSSFSGSYNDLTDKPTIPTKTSDLNNDSGFIGHPDVIVINKGNSEAEVNLDNDIPLGNSTVLLTGRIVYIPYEHELVSIYRDVGSPNGFVIYSVRGNKVNVSKSDGNWKITSNTTFIYSDNAKALYQRITDNTLTTTAKTVPGAINEVKDSIITNYEDLTNKPSIEGVELEGNKSLSDLGITIYDDTEVRELIDTKISKPETDGTAGQILVLQDDGSLAYADNVTEYDDTEIQEAVANKLDKPEVDGTAGQILVLQDDGSLAYADNVTEFDDTEIQEELDTKLDKEKVVQNLDAPDAESVLSTEALNTVLNNKLDRSDGSSLVPDTEIAKIHEHANQDVLDKLSDDGNGKLLYDSNPISVDEMTVIELNDFLDTLEINAVGYVPPTTP